MSIQLLLMLLSGALLSGCATTERDRSQIEAQSAWIAGTSARLRTFAPGAETGRVQLGYGDAYGIPGNEGEALIEFGANGWVYIVTHSWHVEDGVGDISMAIDNSGALWTNSGHVCGGIRFGARDGKVARSSTQFFRRFRDFLGSPWKRL